MRRSQTAAAVDYTDGAMVALYPRELEANALALAGGQPARDLHVTLIYLGTVREAAPLLELVQAVAGGVGSETEALVGEVGGVARFVDNGAGAPIVLLPDVQGLTELGVRLRDELALVGVESASEHGFQPHMTVAYGGDGDAAEALVGKPLHFDTLSVVMGSDRFDYELQSPPQELLADADCPCAALPSGGTMKRKSTTAAADTPTNASQLRWRSLLMVEGKPTDDGRMIDLGAIDWRELPLSLMAMIETGPGGHEGATLAGRIDRIWRVEEASPGVNEIWGEGIFDDSEYGQEVARLVSERMLRGVSVDLAIREFEYRPKESPEGEEEKIDTEEDILDLLFGDDMLFVVTDGSIGAATVCPFPAFADAEISLVSSAPLVWRRTAQSGMTIVEAPASDSAEAQSSDVEAVVDEAVTASAAGLAPLKPPAEWFENPELDEPTPLQVADDGRVFGHVAVWDVCHIGFESECVLAPRSQTDYTYFHLGEVEVELPPAGEKLEADGERIAATIPCGTVTLGTGHAGLRLTRQAAVEHYDNSGTGVADVVAGEDEYGIWFAGAVRPDVPAERVRELRASKLSGDWRNVDGNLELVAVLAVNVPGFPVPRARVASADAEPVAEALLAAGVADRAVLDAVRDRADAEARIADLAAEGRGMDDLIERARSDAAVAA